MRASTHAVSAGDHRVMKTSMGWMGMGTVVATLLAGCGDDNTTTVTTGSSTGDATTGSQTTTAAPTTDEPTTDPCGDGVVQASEQCDDANADDTDLCTAACTAAACGDGHLQPLAGEACDDGAANGPNAACRANCQANVCGDGDIGPGEACDNGPSNADNAACKSGCTLNFCGDGHLGPSEGCDDGNCCSNSIFYVS
jgi:cysteine-rich repeat protein